MNTGQLNATDPRAGVEAGLRCLAGAQVRLKKLQAEMDEAVDAVRRRYDRRIGALEERARRLREELESLCRTDREAVLPAGRKSLKTPYGVVGFRTGESLVRIRDGMSAPAVCRLLRRAGLGDLVRVKESPEKTAVRKALQQGRLGRDQLEDCGLQLVEQGERFHCKVRLAAADETAWPGGQGR
ncbi:MAG: host-nuclease inhibitor Gam family protein [Planctomycetota bacterium]|jgi:phage host-nuclease inhibitor protein Gam